MTERCGCWSGDPVPVHGLCDIRGPARFLKRRDDPASERRDRKPLTTEQSRESWLEWPVACRLGCLALEYWGLWQGDASFGQQESEYRTGPVRDFPPLHAKDFKCEDVRERRFTGLVCP
jgi:hypothetical protein